MFHTCNSFQLIVSQNDGSLQCQQWFSSSSHVYDVISKLGIFISISPCLFNKEIEILEVVMVTKRLSYSSIKFAWINLRWREENLDKEDGQRGTRFIFLDNIYLGFLLESHFFVMFNTIFICQKYLKTYAHMESETKKVSILSLFQFLLKKNKHFDFQILCFMEFHYQVKLVNSLKYFSPLRCKKQQKIVRNQEWRYEKPQRMNY